MRYFYLSFFFAALVFGSVFFLCYTYEVMEGTSGEETVWQASSVLGESVSLEDGEEQAAWKFTCRDIINTTEILLPNSLRLAGQAVSGLQELLYRWFEAGFRGVG